jgi:hypothetical protein
VILASQCEILVPEGCVSLQASSKKGVVALLQQTLAFHCIVVGNQHMHDMHASCSFFQNRRSRVRIGRQEDLYGGALTNLTGNVNRAVMRLDDLLANR